MDVQFVKICCHFFHCCFEVIGGIVFLFSIIINIIILTIRLKFYWFDMCLFTLKLIYNLIINQLFDLIIKITVPVDK